MASQGAAQPSPGMESRGPAAGAPQSLRTQFLGLLGWLSINVPKGDSDLGQLNTDPMSLEKLSSSRKGLWGLKGAVPEKESRKTRPAPVEC